MSSNLLLKSVDRVIDRAHLLRYSVFRRVRLPTAIFTAWATVVWVLASLQLMPATTNAASLVGILSMVTGLMVSFRSGSSYDRWYEGRKTWSAVQGTSRNLLRALAMSAPTLISPIQHKAVRELASLTVAFSFATMHRLRDEPGVAGRPELSRLLPPAIFAAYSAAPTTLPEGGVEHSNASEPERATAALNLPQQEEKKKALLQTGSGGPPENLPLFIIRAMHASLLQSSAGDAKIDPAAYSATLGAMQQFTDQLTALERIRDTPIPMILQIHLQLLLLFFVGSVPLQLVGSLGVFSIPCTAIAAIVYYGIDKSAEEMSDPFGSEPNDLPVGRYCADIQRECEELGLGFSPATVKKDQ